MLFLSVGGGGFILGKTSDHTLTATLDGATLQVCLYSNVST